MKELKTPINVQEMTCRDFLHQFLPRKTSVQYTQAGMFFFEYVAMMHFKDWRNVPMKDIILLLQKKTPQEFLIHRGVGNTRIQTFIDALKRAGVNLDDIPKYKKWLKEYNKLHP
jgi:hypothetical protein